MELKPGYKRTEVGTIPEDWEVKQIQEMCGFIVPGRNKPRVFDGNIPWITTPDLKDGGTVRESKSLLRISLAEAKAVGSKIVPAGSVLMSCVGELGVVALAGCDIVINQQLHAFLPSTAVSGIFLAHAIKTRMAHIDSVATKTALPYLNKDNCNSIPIPVPPRPEQEAIAEALSDTDALVDSLEQLIAKKRDIKQGAMQELLTGNKRLPGFNGEWKFKRLGELGTWKGGMTPSMRNPAFWDKGTVPWISSGDVKSVLLTETTSMITDVAVKEGKTTFLPPRCIVVVTRSGILRRYLPVAMNILPMAINQDIKALIPSDKFSPLYLLHTLIGHGDHILATCMKAGTTVESIELSWLKGFAVPLPEMDEQTAIAAILSNMDAEIAALEAKLAKARQIKQGVMHNLLTGKIRLI